MPSFSFFLLMVSEKKSFEYFFDHLPFMLPLQTIKLSDMDNEAILTSTHNLCFRANIRKHVYPCKPQFYYINVGRGGYDFEFDISNFPFLDGDVPRRPSYGVYISQLIRFARASSHVTDFNIRNKLNFSTSIVLKRLSVS